MRVAFTFVNMVAAVLLFALGGTNEAWSSSCPPGTVRVGERLEQTPTATIKRPICRTSPCVKAANAALVTCNKKLHDDIDACKLTCRTGSIRGHVQQWLQQLRSRMTKSLGRKFELRTPSAVCGVRANMTAVSSRVDEDECVDEVCKNSCLATYEEEGKACVSAHKSGLTACGVP
jgi:hypothetical protein